MSFGWRVIIALLGRKFWFVLGWSCCCCWILDLMLFTAGNYWTRAIGSAKCTHWLRLRWNYGLLGDGFVERSYWAWLGWANRRMHFTFEVGFGLQTLHLNFDRSVLQNSSSFGISWSTSLFCGLVVPWGDFAYSKKSCILTLSHFVQFLAKGQGRIHPQFST